VVCLIDPVGDVYACPFAIHDQFLAGSVLGPGGFAGVWRGSALFRRLREPQQGGACTACRFYDACRGGCMAAKFFTGLPLDGPDPECVQGYGERALAAAGRNPPKPSGDHSRRALPVLVPLAPPVRACAESPLAGIPLNAVPAGAT
jgi:radical SAM protein with 4Fe4S-binding SPASM domain